jgi:hypothetical protein
MKRKMEFYSSGSLILHMKICSACIFQHKIEVRGYFSVSVYEWPSPSGPFLYRFKGGGMFSGCEIAIK